MIEDDAQMAQAQQVVLNLQKILWEYEKFIVGSSSPGQKPTANQTTICRGYPSSHFHRAVLKELKRVSPTERLTRLEAAL
jgi:hypothetical protein